METQTQTTLRLTREEGMAARLLGRTEEACPYPADGGYFGDLRGHWMSGFAEANGKLNSNPHLRSIPSPGKLN